MQQSQEKQKMPFHCRQVQAPFYDYNNYKMGRKLQNIPLRYSKIDFNVRVQLISSVLEKGKSILQASRELGIKFSTAKLIVKRYREGGYIFKKKEDQEGRRPARDKTAQVSNTSKQNNGNNANPENQPSQGTENSLVSLPLLLPCYYDFCSKMVYFVGSCTMS